MDEKLPFIGEIISHFALIVISFLFLDRLYALIFVFVFLVILVFRLNIWSFSAAVLLAAATQYRFEGNSSALMISVVALVLGSAMEIGVKIYKQRTHPSVQVTSSIGKMTFYSILGYGVPLLLLLPVCNTQKLLDTINTENTPYYQSTPKVVLQMVNCGLEFALEPLVETLPQEESVLKWANQILLVLVRTYFISPYLWVPLFAAIARVGINNPTKLFFCFVGITILVGVFGFPLGGVIGLIAGYLVGYIGFYLNSIVLMGAVDFVMLAFLILVSAVFTGIVTGWRFPK